MCRRPPCGSTDGFCQRLIAGLKPCVSSIALPHRLQCVPPRNGSSRRNTDRCGAEIRPPTSTPLGEQRLGGRQQLGGGRVQSGHVGGHRRRAKQLCQGRGVAGQLAKQLGRQLGLVQKKRSKTSTTRSIGASGGGSAAGACSEAAGDCCSSAADQCSIKTLRATRDALAGALPASSSSRPAGDDGQHLPTHRSRGMAQRRINNRADENCPFGIHRPQGCHDGIRIAPASEKRMGDVPAAPKSAP
jgi:hypothetical protein